MKNLYYFILIVALIQTDFLLAQTKTDLRFGFRAGYSLATQYGIDIPDLDYTVETKYRHGFAGGIIVHVPITESFSLYQEYLYVMKGSRHNIFMPDRNLTTRVKYNLNYFEIPVVLRYTFVKLGEVKIYGTSGFVLSFLINGESRVEGEIDLGNGPYPFSQSTKMEGVDIFDYSFLYGLGLDFNFLNKNFFFEYRQTIGWNTLMMPTAQGEDPAPLRNQAYTFTLGMFIN
jgi:hypothetical protein